jgi:hypothetical protein
MRQGLTKQVQGELDQDNGENKKGERAWLPRLRKMDTMNYLS